MGIFQGNGQRPAELSQRIFVQAGIENLSQLNGIHAGSQQFKSFPEKRLRQKIGIKLDIVRYKNGIVNQIIDFTRYLRKFRCLSKPSVIKPCQLFDMLIQLLMRIDIGLIGLRHRAVFDNDNANLNNFPTAIGPRGLQIHDGILILFVCHTAMIIS
ncbi:hypothetical protein STRDD11_01048 [Streptococcus sp. DD11]|nr:hypothetical protein STRDD11_01048 [Streptococcus sp. DD11]